MNLDELNEAWQILTDREKTIITKRFGLNGHKPETLKQVGKGLGITREYVRQQQNIALSKLRRAGNQLREFGEIKPFLRDETLPIPKPKATPKPVVKPKAPRLPRTTDRQRLDWLEHAIRHQDMQLDASLFGSYTIYIAGKGESRGRGLRGVLDVAMKRNPLPQ